MKLLIAFLILTSGIESTWARGIEKAQIKFTMDVEPGQESKVAELGKMAYGKPSGTMIVSIDLNGDGVFESYKINPVKPTPDLGEIQIGWATINKESQSNEIKNDLIVSARDSGSGMATGRRQRLVSSDSEVGVEGSNGAISYKKTTEVYLAKKHISNVKYESFSIQFTDPSREMVNSMRKGWDGSIKGGVVKISLVDDSGSVLNSIEIFQVPNQGVTVLCSSVPCPGTVF